MKILSCDASYSSFGLIIYDTDLNEVIYNHSIRFNSLSALNKSEIEMFKNQKHLYESYIEIKNQYAYQIKADKKYGIKKSKAKEIVDKYRSVVNEYWNNIRLSFYLDFINNLKEKYDYDLVIAESQFENTMSEIFSVVRVSAVSKDKVISFLQFKPISWHKILFDYARIEKTQAKAAAKEKIDKYFDLKGVVLSSGDEYDAMCLIITYLIQSGLYKEIDINMKQNFIVEKVMK